MNSFTVQNQVIRRNIVNNIETPTDSLILKLNEIKVKDGNLGLTILIVGYIASDFDQTTSSSKPFEKKGAVQVVSLGHGNGVYVYKNGNEFMKNQIDKGPFFLNDGQTFVIEEVEAGAVIVMTEGGYGYSEQRRTGNTQILESPMPLLSLGLAFYETLFYAFRASENPNGINKGLLHVVCGPIKSKISLRKASDNSTVLNQQDTTLEPFTLKTFVLDGNIEYTLKGTEPVMACINARMGEGNESFYDSRLIMPPTNDGMTWPRNGQISALYPNTKVRYYNNRGDSNLTITPPTPAVNGFIVNGPGNPVDTDVVTGNSSGNYDPEGCTRYIANGLITAFSGADGAGLEATPMVPISTMSYKVAIVGIIRDTGSGAANSITVCSPYEGSFQLYSYNEVTELAELVSVLDSGGPPLSIIPIRRRATNTSPPTSLIDQRTPASAQIKAVASASSPETYGLQNDFLGGYIISNVPCMVVINTTQTNQAVSERFLGSSGNQVIGVRSRGDETVMFGISPDELKHKIVLSQDSNPLYYREVPGVPGNDTWVIA